MKYFRSIQENKRDDLGSNSIKRKGSLLLIKITGAVHLQKKSGGNIKLEQK